MQCQVEVKATRLDFTKLLNFTVCFILKFQPRLSFRQKQNWEDLWYKDTSYTDNGVHNLQWLQHVSVLNVMIFTRRLISSRELICMEQECNFKWR